VDRNPGKWHRASLLEESGSFIFSENYSVDFKKGAAKAFEIRLFSAPPV
jgi:hypothetical protein